jgi:hypothetical protein
MFCTLSELSRLAMLYNIMLILHYFRETKVSGRGENVLRMTDNTMFRPNFRNFLRQFCLAGEIHHTHHLIMYPTSRNSKDYFEVEEVKLLPDEEVFQQEATKYGSRIFSSLKFIFLARTKSIHESEKEYVEKSWRFMRSSPLLLHLAVLSIYTTLFLLAYLQAASLPVPDALVYSNKLA